MVLLEAVVLVAAASVGRLWPKWGGGPPARGRLAPPINDRHADAVAQRARDARVMPIPRAFPRWHRALWGLPIGLLIVCR